MPSPIGHGLAGLAIGLASEPATVAQTSGWRLSKYAMLGAVFAALPDADLLYGPIHRGVSHSIGATAFLMIIAAVVTGWVTGRVHWRWVLLIGAAHGSHILWIGWGRIATRRQASRRSGRSAASFTFRDGIFFRRRNAASIYQARG